MNSRKQAFKDVNSDTFVLVELHKLRAISMNLHRYVAGNGAPVFEK
jgi:hypothetical protein